MAKHEDNTQQNVPTIRQKLQQQVFQHAYQHTVNPYSKAVFGQLARCHTAQQGMHQLRFSDSSCGQVQLQYHNCGNRHCPNCGGMRRQQWLDDKTSELLPTAYYHVVFTLPHELNSLIMGNRKVLFRLLLEASSYTLLKLAKDKKWLGAKPDIISILHTWGQQLSFHPHVHCIVSGGGVQEDAKGQPEQWIPEKRRNRSFLFPAPLLKKVYKTYYLQQVKRLLQQDKLQTTDKAATMAMLADISRKRWNVYAKKPFGGPSQVLEYLGRYTHKVAITAHRIKAISSSSNTITFTYKDYHKRNTKEEQQQMTIPIAEFIRRFEQHILPRGFVKIRHYGYLRNHKRSERLQLLFRLMKQPPPPPKVQVPVSQRMLEQYGKDIGQCPQCGAGRLDLVATYHRGVLTQTYETAMETTVRNKAPG